MAFVKSLFLAIVFSLSVSSLLSFHTLYSCALLVLILNYKMLPLGHTLRLAVPLARLRILPAARSPRSVASLFEPYSVPSHACILECDVYIHKSNSTYLLDLDVSRMELLSRLFAYALRRTRSNLMLAGVDISFRREILPFQAYDTRSCILTWDRKWLYVVSYHIQAGAVIEESDGWVKILFGNGEQAESKKGLIFAVAISKVVAKAGRRTVSPAELLELGGFVDATTSAEMGRIEAIEGRRGLGLELLQGKG